MLLFYVINVMLVIIEKENETINNNRSVQTSAQLKTDL